MQDNKQFEKLTEAESTYEQVEKMSVQEILGAINAEDHSIPAVVQKAIPQINALVEKLLTLMQDEGRLYYIGAGTSGRLGILDASECVPTFGVDRVTAIIAGGERAISSAVEFAEDHPSKGWDDLSAKGASARDFVIGISASGTTPYVLEALNACRREGIKTGAITCNPGSPIAGAADFPVELATGPEFITGSTRMKAGTAQKMALNMISTTTMIKLGYTEGNKMVNMQLSNNKLIDRGTKMAMKRLGITNYEQARALLLTYGSVSELLKKYRP